MRFIRGAIIAKRLVVSVAQVTTSLCPAVGSSGRWGDSITSAQPHPEQGSGERTLQQTADREGKQEGLRELGCRGRSTLTIKVSTDFRSTLHEIFRQPRRDRSRISALLVGDHRCGPQVSEAGGAAADSCRTPLGPAPRVPGKSEALPSRSTAGGGGGKVPVTRWTALSAWASPLLAQ